MRLLNLGCGGLRVQDSRWTNLDELRKHLKPGTPERTNLDAEANYCEFTIGSGPLPFADQAFDAILCQHVIEHMPCHQAVEMIKECWRILKPNGFLVASVPNVDYFMENLYRDTRANAPMIFGEPISEPKHETFFSYALFHSQHCQVLNGSGLEALLVAGGFRRPSVHLVFNGHWMRAEQSAAGPIVAAQLNRLKFSAIRAAYKE